MSGEVKWWTEVQAIPSLIAFLLSKEARKMSINEELEQALYDIAICGAR
jgi:hypothetical protein